MIQQRTVLKVSDNSGAKAVRCIKVFGGFKKKYAKIGDVILVSIKHLRNRSKRTSKVRKGEIYKAVIIRTKTKVRKVNGVELLYFKNTVALINKHGNPLGTRILTFVPKFLRKKFPKFASISFGIT